MALNHNVIPVQTSLFVGVSPCHRCCQANLMTSAPPRSRYLTVTVADGDDIGDNNYSTHCLRQRSSN